MDHAPDSAIGAHRVALLATVCVTRPSSTLRFGVPDKAGREGRTERESVCVCLTEKHSGLGAGASHLLPMAEEGGMGRGPCWYRKASQRLHPASEHCKG